MAAVSPLAEQIVLAHLPHLRRLAWTCANHSRDLYHDLVGYGAIGLCRAAVGYRSSRGVKFWSYAEHRALGAMRDGLRQMDRWPRRQRESIKADLPDAPQVVPEEVLQYIPDWQYERQDQALARKERDEWVGAAVARLRPKERLLIHLFYAEDKFLREAAVVLGVTESRASQIMLRAHNKLRRYLCQRPA